MQHGHGEPRTLLHQAANSGMFVTRRPELALPSFAAVFGGRQGLGEEPAPAPESETTEAGICAVYPRLPPFSSLLAPPPASLEATPSVPTPGESRRKRKHRRPGVTGSQVVSAPLDIASAASRWIESGGRRQRAICLGCNRTFKRRDGREIHWAASEDCERRHAEAIQGTPAVVDYNEMLENRRRARKRQERKERLGNRSLCDGSH